MRLPQLSLTLSRPAKPRKDGSAPACDHYTPEQLSEIVQDNVVNVAKVAGALYVGKKVVDTAAQIAVIAAKAYF